MRKKANKKKRIFDPEKLGFLPELKGAFCCTVVEDKSILIENGGEVVVFTDKVIMLENCGKRICIRGEGLSIYEMSHVHIGVMGSFAAIEYEKEVK